MRPCPRQARGGPSAVAKTLRTTRERPRRTAAAGDGAAFLLPGLRFRILQTTFSRQRLDFLPPPSRRVLASREIKLSINHVTCHQDRICVLGTRNCAARSPTPAQTPAIH